MHADLCLWIVWVFLVLVWLRSVLHGVPAVIFDVLQPAALLLLAACLSGVFR